MDFIIFSFDMIMYTNTGGKVTSLFQVSIMIFFEQIQNDNNTPINDR